MRKLLLLLLIISTKLSVAFDIDTLLYSGSLDKKINIVVLADGYQTNELNKFIADANTFKNDFLSETPYNQYRNYFNIFAIKVNSVESGASHPGTASDVAEPAHPVSIVNNYFGSTFDVGGIHRLLVATNTAAINNVLATHIPQYDQVIVLVNTAYSGGSGGAIATAFTGSQFTETVIHELGHSFAGLNDEYFAGNQFLSEAPNQTKDNNTSTNKWKNWLGFSSMGLTIGINQMCCGGNTSQWYIPCNFCKMQYLGVSFCAVCIQENVEKIHSLTSPLNSYFPLDTELANVVFPQIFKIDLVKTIPNTINSTWVLNNDTIYINLDSIQIVLSDLIDGENILKTYIEDQSSFLRVDNHSNIHIEVVVWNMDSVKTEDSIIQGVKLTANHIEMDVYPNPVNDILFIDYSSANSKINQITIVNLKGELLYEVNTTINENHIELDLRGISDKNIIINFIFDDGSIISKKIINQ